MLTYLDHFQQNLVNIQILIFLLCSQRKQLTLIYRKKITTFWNEREIRLKEEPVAKSAEGSPDFRKITEIKFLTQNVKKL